MIKSYYPLVASALIGTVTLIAIPARAEEPPASTAPTTNSIEAQPNSSPQSDERREAPVSVSQTQPAPASEPVSTRIPWTSRIFAAPSMQQ